MSAGACLAREMRGPSSRRNMQPPGRRARRAGPLPRREGPPERMEGQVGHRAGRRRSLPEGGLGARSGEGKAPRPLGPQTLRGTPPQSHVEPRSSLWPRLDASASVSRLPILKETAVTSPRLPRWRAPTRQGTGAATSRPPCGGSVDQPSRRNRSPESSTRKRGRQSALRPAISAGGCPSRGQSPGGARKYDALPPRWARR